jgi:glutamate-1-semialdehyde 2,1-aminomutase
VSAVVEFNDIAALEAALASREVACVLTEPVMTNYGMIEPQPGFLAALREMTERTGTLLIIDETHTFSNGPGGYSALHGLMPDLFVLGKSVGGGIPVGLYGLSRDTAERFWHEIPKVNPALIRQSSHLGFGGTLAGSALQVAAVRVVLERVLTDGAFTNMLALADALAGGARASIARAGLPWYVAHSGARVEMMYAAHAPCNAADVAGGRNSLLEALLHVYFLNHGIVITPFHSMMLICPATSREDVARYLAVLGEFISQLQEPAAAGAAPT